MKTYDVYLLPDAIKDLEVIYEYIAEQSGFPERAWSKRSAVLHMRTIRAAVHSQL